MLFSTILVQTLLTSAAFAFPTSRERFGLRLARRDSRGTRPLSKVTPDPGSVLLNNTGTGGTGLSGQPVEYSSNWAGGVLNDEAVSGHSNAFCLQSYLNNHPLAYPRAPSAL